MAGKLDLKQGDPGSSHVRARLFPRENWKTKGQLLCDSDQILPGILRGHEMRIG